MKICGGQFGTLVLVPKVNMALGDETGAAEQTPDQFTVAAGECKDFEHVAAVRDFAAPKETVFDENAGQTGNDGEGENNNGGISGDPASSGN